MYYPIFSYFHPMITSFQLPTYMQQTEVVPTFPAPIVSQSLRQPEAQENGNLQASPSRNVNLGVEVSGGQRP